MLSGLLKATGVYRIYEKWLIEQVRKTKMPRHLGIILDGNRRWAHERNLKNNEGHKLGAIVGENFLDWCLGLNVKTVTVFIFSAENFQRSMNEVEGILSLIERYATKLGSDPRIHNKKVRIKAIGRLDYLPQSLKKVLEKIEGMTEKYDGHYLNLAIAYGGRAEIIDAAQRIAKEAQENRIRIDEINEKSFTKYLYTAHLPNPYPDLMIRTSGEERLSGFLLWQSAYSELCFIDVSWPEFRKIDLLRAIRTYQKRVRRFGK
ncbi:di-trans,poly-cis-decaprenylcistransferase [Candidatus Bathyarchaeota archaeon]|jgi:tritrans,polycis-undecaprenyl-diphosphate synthase [geranylgeranyl-diphosphate specific]|nr:di-trans,poly-cis-decaprenylcistransferase [Candidatus Bathyarchaeota archaeon]